MANLPQTANDLFDTLLPLGLQAYPERVKDLNGILTFKIGTDTWTLDAKASPPRIIKNSNIASDCTIEMEYDDFKKIMEDHKHGIDLFFAGKIRVTGDTAVAMRLSLFFEITRPMPV